MAFPKGVTGPGLTRRNIVKIEDALDLKGYVPGSLDEREVAAWIGHLGQFVHCAFFGHHRVAA
jgi:hypothetical protein